MTDSPDPPDETASAAPAAEKAGDAVSAGGPSFRLRVVAALLCGTAMWAGVPDMSLWWLGFVGWVPWLWAIEGVSTRRAFLLGAIAGGWAIFIGYYWMTELLMRFAGFGEVSAAGVHLLFATYHGTQWAFSAALLVWLRKRTGRSTLLLAPMCWTAATVLLPNIFPTYMALMWCWQPRWIQLAELGGVATVDFAMVAINAALYEFIRSRGTGDMALHKRARLVLAALLIGIPTYGTIRMRQVEASLEDAPIMKIGVVQGNFGIRTYAQGRYKPRILRELQRVSGELQAEGADVVLWGETAFPFHGFHRGSEHDFGDRSRRKVQRGFDIPVILGAVTDDKTGENPYPWNTAWLMDADGNLQERYDKNYPLIFGEWVPLVNPEWYLKVIPSASYLNRGDGPSVMHVDGHPVGPLICYEDILPEFVRDVANSDVSVLVNLTNDSWFGKSREQGEHLGLAVFRAVEHRRGLVRAVNAGASAYVDPVGRVVERTRVTDSDTGKYEGAEGFIAEVPMVDPEFRTLYGMTGRGFAGLIFLGLLFFSLPSQRRDD